MPLTPLFPLKDQAITMKQGRTGDCYLLAALDCIFNSGTKERQRIESMFKQRQDGSVEVRVSQGKFSKNLVGRTVAGKFRYRYDPIKQQDIFIFSKERLKVIDSGIGLIRPVTSNSLAVKIMERLTSYYYDNISDGDGVQSVVEHNNKDRFDINTEIPLLAHLFGTTIIDNSNFENVTKHINPPTPIYFTMNYGTQDAFGVYHARHALRLQKVEPITAKPGFFIFTLVNPWDNTKTEKIEMDKTAFTITKKCKCAIFRFKSQQPDSEIGLDIAELPKGQALLSALENEAVLPAKVYQHVIRLYRQLPWIGEYLAKLDPKKKYEVAQSIHAEHGDATSWWEKRKDEVIEFYKKQDPTIVLPNIVNKVTTFETAFLAASYEYQQKFKCDIKTAKNKIRQGIIAYHKKSSLESLSVCGGLRELFTKKIFKKAHIDLLILEKSKACLDVIQKFNIDYKNIDFSSVTEKRDSLVASLKQELNNITNGFFDGYESLPPNISKVLLTKIEEINEKSTIKLRELVETDKQDLKDVIDKYKYNIEYQNAYSHALALQIKLPCIGKFFKACKDVNKLLGKMNTPHLDLDDFIDLLGFSELVLFTDIYKTAYPSEQIPIARPHPQLLEKVINQAKVEKMIADSQFDKNIIENGLHQYLKSNNPNYLTSSANLRNFFYCGLFSKQLISERQISSSLTKIAAMQISFAGINIREEVNMHAELLINNLEKLIDNSANEYEKVKNAKQNKIFEIQHLSRLRIQQLSNEALFHKIGLDTHLTSINNKVLELNEKSKKNPAAYGLAAKEAATLHTALTVATQTFLRGESTPGKLKNVCERAINAAMIELGNHRGWKSVLYNTLYCIATLGIGPLCYGFRKIKTNSVERIDAFMNVINAIK